MTVQQYICVPGAAARIVADERPDEHEPEPRHPPCRPHPGPARHRWSREGRLRLAGIWVIDATKSTPVFHLKVWSL